MKRIFDEGETLLTIVLQFVCVTILCIILFPIVHARVIDPLVEMLLSVNDG